MPSPVASYHCPSRCLLRLAVVSCRVVRSSCCHVNFFTIGMTLQMTARRNGTTRRTTTKWAKIRHDATDNETMDDSTTLTDDGTHNHYLKQLKNRRRDGKTRRTFVVFRTLYYAGCRVRIDQKLQIKSQSEFHFNIWCCEQPHYKQQHSVKYKPNYMIEPEVRLGEFDITCKSMKY